MALDTSLCVNDCWYRLGFSNLPDMSAANTWVTTAELYQFASDAIAGLARSTALFLTYDETTTVTPGNAKYPLPARHVFTESAWLVYSAPVSVQLLRLSSAAQLFALDASWPTAAPGPPLRYSLNADDIYSGILYPSPAAGATLCTVLEVYPADVTSGSPALAAVTPILQDAVTLAMLAGALGKESDSAKPEVAKHCRERMAMYAAIVNRLWGVAS